MTTKDQLSESMLNGLKTFHAVTGARCEAWDLAGPANAATRQLLMNMLSNGGKHSKAQSGVMALESKLLSLANLPGPFTCQRDREEKLTEWVKGVVS